MSAVQPEKRPDPDALLARVQQDEARQRRALPAAEEHGARAGRDRREKADRSKPAGAVLNRMQPGLQGREVAVELQEDLPLALIDGGLIEQVLSNLLENALKYTPPGSPIEIEAWAAGGEITVSVVDRGPGIKPGDEERVFDKFHRGVPEGTVGGTGLGLTICRAIVEARGGRIWAENRLVGGAMFCFTLPSGGRPPTVERETEAA